MTGPGTRAPRNGTAAPAAMTSPSASSSKAANSNHSPASSTARSLRCSGRCRAPTPCAGPAGIAKSRPAANPIRARCLTGPASCATSRAQPRNRAAKNFLVAARPNFSYHADHNGLLIIRTWTLHVVVVAQWVGR
ncbi:exported hypothetical protein [Burkholderiales bacterium]|nr:exported hypothetical protein [Burkholderiales bacterium]